MIGAGAVGSFLWMGGGRAVLLVKQRRKAVEHMLNTNTSTHGPIHTPRKIFTGMLTAIVQEEVTTRGWGWGGVGGVEGRNVMELSCRKRHWHVSGADRDPPTSRVSGSNMRDAAREHVLRLTLPSEIWGERRSRHTAAKSGC